MSENKKNYIDFLRNYKIGDVLPVLNYVTELEERIRDIKTFIEEKHSINCGLTYEIIEFINNNNK